jgi:hypothetical protein
MSFILAIEPDRRQAARISALARNPLNAEIVITDTAEGAVAAIAQRVPDLILTPRLLSPRDEAILDGRLRELDAAGRHVQMLMIPLLGSPNRKAGKKENGLLNRLRWTTGDDVANGCDPALFAAEIAQYLERATADRAARGAHDEGAHAEQGPPTVEAQASGDGGTVANETAPPMAATQPPAATSTIDRLEVPDNSQAQEPWQDVALHDNGAPDGDISIQPEELNAFVDTLEAQLGADIVAQEDDQRQPAAEETDPLVTEFSVDSDRPLPTPGAQSGRPSVLSSALKPAKRPDDDVNDEWGFFDPQRVGFAELIAKLQEITE